MVQYWNRKPARIGVFTDGVISSLNVLVLVTEIIFPLLAFHLPNSIKIGDTQNLKVDENQKLDICAYLIATWILVGVTAVATGVHIWASVGFLLATAKISGEESIRPLERCKVWRNVAAILFCVGITTNIMTSSFVSLGMTIVVRCVALTFVLRFIDELKGISHGVRGRTYTTATNAQCYHINE